MATESPEIDYSLLGEAVSYYKNSGYEYFEALWMVDPDYSRLTLPTEHGAFIVTNGQGHYKHLVGSAEQAFIELIMRGRLKTNKLYVSCSPCFRRGDNWGILNQETFMKVELSYATYDAADSTWEWTLRPDAQEFFKERLCMHNIKLEENTEDGSVDIMAYDKELEFWIEIGSYGCRELLDDQEKTIYIHYGTGLALPRAQRIYR